jgi:hypothetical protein
VDVGLQEQRIICWTRAASSVWSTVRNSTSPRRDLSPSARSRQSLSRSPRVSGTSGSPFVRWGLGLRRSATPAERRPMACGRRGTSSGGFGTLSRSVGMGCAGGGTGCGAPGTLSERLGGGSAARATRSRRRAIDSRRRAGGSGGRAGGSEVPGGHREAPPGRLKVARGHSGLPAGVTRPSPGPPRAPAPGRAARRLGRGPAPGPRRGVRRSDAARRTAPRHRRRAGAAARGPPRPSAGGRSLETGTEAGTEVEG